MKTVLLAMISFQYELFNNNILWYTENQAVESIANFGSKQKHLQKMALEIFHLCFKQHINLQVKWIPRRMNFSAEALSKIIDYDDYSLNNCVFADLDKLYSPFTVDRFACYYNT